MAKMALLNWCMKFELTKSILLKHYENANKKKYSYAGKSTKRGFSKKAIARIEIFLLF